jgi:hypothetical protein
MSFLKNPIVQGVVTVVIIIAVLKAFGSKIPLIGPYISIP